MQKNKVKYVCKECGKVESKWMGRCTACGSWNSFEEQIVEEETLKGKRVNISTTNELMVLKDIELSSEMRLKTGFDEFDRVLGGGLMKGSAILLGGEPGIGKSTLMLQTVANCSSQYKVLYVSGEESASQIKQRAIRLGLDSSKVYIYNNTKIENLLNIIEELKPQIIVIDSLQTLTSSQINSIAGSSTQMRSCAMELVGKAKQIDASVFFIGHVTKDGLIAGPKIVEHLVDTVLYFDQSTNGVRIIRAVKNRFGSVDELGIFKMDEKGLQVIKNPSGLFLNKRAKGHLPPGIAFTAVVEGSRTFIVEIQALTIPTKGGYSRIYSDRIDVSRVTRVAAILERHTNLCFGNYDIYVNVGGGIKLKEVSIELALAAALASSLKGKTFEESCIAFGELSLAGEVRPVNYNEKRVKAAIEMGFEEVIAPNTFESKKIKSLKCFNILDVVNLI
ncbi:MAG: DNA repair protein RadA [Pleomorphochaeta sp.]